MFIPEFTKVILPVKYKPKTIMKVHTPIKILSITNNFLPMILYQSFHRVLQYIAQFKLVAVAHFGEYIPKAIRNASRKVYRHLPAFGELADMMIEKIVQPVFNNVFYHVMPAVFCKKDSKRSEVTVC